jgi:hypothetical protein
LKLVVCTPSRGSVSLGYRDTFVLLKDLCEERAVGFGVFDDTTSGQLSHSRNLLLYRIASELEDEDWALWMDSDVSFDPILVIDVLHREEPIVARAYPTKAPPDGQDFANMQQWSVYPALNGMKVIWSEDKQLVEAQHTGFGCLLMRAFAAKEMQAQYGLFGRAGTPSIPAFDLLEDGDGRAAGEDGSFCYRWRVEMGGKIWIAPDGFIRNGDRGGNYLEELAEGIGLPRDSTLFQVAR